MGRRSGAVGSQPRSSIHGSAGQRRDSNIHRRDRAVSYANTPQRSKLCGSRSRECTPRPPSLGLGQTVVTSACAHWVRATGPGLGQTLLTSSSVARARARARAGARFGTGGRAKTGAVARARVGARSRQY
jgi:hypothetical protein